MTIIPIASTSKRNSIETRQDDRTMSAAQFYIPTLPGLPEDAQITMYGGHIPSSPPLNGLETETESDAHIYFHLIRNKHIGETEKTIIWFNGGPGCSSFDGALMEVGPIRLIPGSGGKLKVLEGAWNEYANVLFIDQPVGTGYSYVNTNSYVHELNTAAGQVVEFLVNFYQVFPEFAHHDTYLAGESYAGQYIPYFAQAILATTIIRTPLKGIIIGNGWFDPVSQYPAYLDFAIKAGIVKMGTDLEKEIRKTVVSCLEELSKDGGENVKIHNSGCEGILSQITDSTVQSVNGVKMCVNNYDVRLTDTHPACGMNWPPDLSDITPYLQRPDVKAALHANRKAGGWTECSGNVGSNFFAVTSKPSVTLLPDLLKKIPILFFAGDQDLICNHVGIEKMIANMTWGGETGFGNATGSEWYVDGKEAGNWTEARGLTYVKVASASHMVPYDQPLAAHDMLLRFLGIDLLGAAGPAARVPSRVGDEQEAVLGETHPDGSIVVPVLSPDFTPLIEQSTKAADTKTEALVNAGSALFIIIIMLLAVLIYCVLKRRLGGSGRGRGGKGSIVSGLGLGGGGTNGGRSSMGRRDEEAGNEDPHELDQLVKGAEIFGLGGSDDEDDDDEHEGGRKVKNG